MYKRQDYGLAREAVYIRRARLGLALHIGANVVGAQTVKHNDDEVHGVFLSKEPLYFSSYVNLYKVTRTLKTRVRPSAQKKEPNNEYFVGRL